MAKRKHRVVSITTVYTVVCGKCGEEFEEQGGDQMASTYPLELEDGTPLECTKCETELDTTFEEEE